MFWMIIYSGTAHLHRNIYTLVKAFAVGSFITRPGLSLTINVKNVAETAISYLTPKFIP